MAHFILDGRLVTVANPGYKPVHALTDRAKRYRANSPELRPDGPKRCLFCGSKKNPTVHHLDGDESHLERGNLVWACKSCNTAIGAAYKRAGLGVRTRQYNPQKAGGGVPTYEQYLFAVGHHQRGAWDEGGAILHAIPPATRSEYASRLWGFRKKTYGASGGSRSSASEVPF